jgi:hypothetical protein
MSTKDLPDMEEREAIVARLRQLSSEQSLIEQACARYPEWYQIAPEGLPEPQNVQITFRLQTLYFQPGVSIRLPAYITTMVELYVPQQDFGLYSLFTNLDGSYRDDVMTWASVTNQYAPWKDYGVINSIEPVELRNVPAALQDIFPKLARLAQAQRLVEQAIERCSAWFQHHPKWHERYPLSLAEGVIKKEVHWFHEYPHWYEHYPAIAWKEFQVRIAFAKQILCFNHAHYPFPHLKTYLNVYAGGYEIGAYCLVTHLDGTVNEDLSMIVPYPFDRNV